MANPKNAGRKRKLISKDTDQAYQKRQAKEFEKLQTGLKELQPTPPAHLPTAGKRLWRDLAPELIKIGNVKQLDRINLESLCSEYAIFLQAEKDWEDNKTYMQSKSGYVKNPAISVISECTRNMKTLCADLGISFNYRAQQNIVSEHYHAAKHDKITPLSAVNFNG
ncbi:phage terminase small subunit P27 family [Lactobacillus sp. ESL0677]|uniref:phage terminase small subunit P27 family n=1 Tax=Lactobacillus sp. ESL0677 TaxID=2983208 RepID=UPI0023F8B029|nr:phage terminase small subunit P27 family [Lactobacillus sp. ESL0677]WEV36225.1 phage terminase small subunit P27 family [Lactobacillus sp. ESL0677]